MGTPEKRARVASAVFRSYAEILGIEEGAARHVHITRFGTLVLLVAIFFSQTFNPLSLRAASYTNTWTSQSDFVSDAAGSGGTTTKTDVDTTTTAGSVTLARASASDLTFAETFTGHTYIATTSISSAADFSGNSRTATFGNQGNGTNTTYPDAITGKVGQGLYFPATTKVLFTPTFNPGTGNFTMSAWVKTTAQHTGEIISDVSGGRPYKRLYWSETRIAFALSDNVDSVSLQSGTGKNDGNWHHIVGVRSGSAFSFYVDGSLADSTTNANVDSVDTGINAQMVIGARPDGTPLPFNGSIDDVRVYTRALSATEISRIYASGAASLVDPTLAGYWTLNTADISGSQVNDISGSGYHGSKVGAPTSVSGKLSEALSFDGIDDYVALSASTGFIYGASGSGPVSGSVSMWVKGSSQSKSLYTEPGDGSGGGSGVYLNTSGSKFAVSITRFDFSGLLTAVSTQTILDDSWHHVVWSDSGGSAKVYIDGAQDATSFTYNASSGVTNPFTTSVAAKTLGGTPSNFFNGSIDDVRVFRRALTASEASQLYNSGNGTSATNIPDANFWGYWTFHDASDAVLHNGSLVFFPEGATIQTATSTVIDSTSANIGYATLTKNDTPGNGTVTYYLSNDGGTTWASVTPGSQYTFSTTGSSLKWKIALTGGATVQDISIAYNGYFSPGTITNMVKDAGGDAIWTSLSWNGTTPAGTTIKFRTRGATSAEGSGALSGKEWSDYITTSGGTIKANGAGGASNPTYRYMEFELSLTSTTGAVTPTLTDFTVTYAINGPPDFNANFPSASAGGVRIFQVATSTDANWGKVQIDYSIRDTDTLSGTFNPGYVTPTVQYNTGSGWNNVSSTYLNSGALDNKAVSQSDYTTYTAYWDAKTHIGAVYSGSTQIKITINDNEIIYNTATGTSSAVTLDTTNPVVALRIDGTSSTSTVTGTLTDNSLLKDYQISNNSDFSADGSNGISGSWQTISNASSTTLNLPWTLAGTSSKTVYVKVRDVYGNTNSTSIIAPPTASFFEIYDLSNPSANSFREFLAWSAYTSQSGATFSKYEVSRSSDGGTNYSVLANVTDAATNYYLDTSAASTTRYYYKMRTIDTDTDSSNYSSVVNDQPDGQGGSDTVAPNITSVVIDTVRNTSARVTWTTDELSTSQVNYGLTNLYGGTQTGTSYVTSHSVYISNLLPSTLYYVRVKATDIAGNIGTNDNSGASYTFTTAGGPVISNVTVESVNDNSATIFWNTTTSSDSYVYYSTNNNLSSPTQVGSATLVSATTSPYQHRVTLSGLSSGATYYFYVKSTDGDSNSTTADNNGSYYSFVTTTDTTPPVISNISTPVLSPTNAVIIWTTDELSDSYVEYGTTASTTSGSYSNNTTLDSTRTISHVATLSDLGTNSTYYYRVQSRDAAGNRATSDENTFTTTQTGEVIVISVGGGGGGGASRSTTPPTISKFTVDPVNAFDATVNIETNPETVAFVHYGDGPSYTLSGGDSVVSNSKKIKLKNLRPGSTYRVMAKVMDKDGNTADSREETFKTKFPTEALDNINILDKVADFGDQLDSILESALPSIFPPFIESPRVASTTEDAATITWTTNVKSYSAIDYAEDAFFKEKSEYETQLSNVKDRVTNHSMNLINLKPNTKYHFSARAFIFPQVVGKSADMTFVTKAAPIKAQVLDVRNDSFRVVWTTDELTSSIVEYKNQRTGVVNKVTDDKLVKNHDIQVQNLPPGTTYQVNASGINENGNVIAMEGLLSLTTGTDSTPPTIASLKIDSAMVPGRTDRVQSIVTWKSDEPSTSVVSYEEGSGTSDQPLKNKVEDTQGLVLNHVVILPNLTPGTIYRIQVSSTDSAGNVLNLPVRTIVTPRQNESIVDIIFKNFSDTFQFVNNVR